jgi:phosphatidylserine/phosphatidylglycerophosphate/cardiolipin synthase-like enzyme
VAALIIAAGPGPPDLAGPRVPAYELACAALTGPPPAGLPVNLFGDPEVMDFAAWLLTAAERGNPRTGIDQRHPGGAAFTCGNEVRPLPHGRVYFADLLTRLRAVAPGDLVLFTDWRGDPDERLDGPGTEVSRELSAAAERGALVKGLIWRSHLDRFQFSEVENRHLGEEIEAAGGTCVLDMRVRTGGSHHQKLVVLRHPARPELDVAYVGGIDLCHGRRDDAAHEGDAQPVRLSSAYGPRPPWHDVQLSVRGPAVGDVEAVFRERWCDPAPLTRNPIHRLGDLVRRDDTRPGPLPPQLPDPPGCGSHAVQILRTYPYRRPGYPFAPGGERTVARGYIKALAQARHLIYLEDQYLWSAEVAAPFARALATQPTLHMIVVVPMFADQDSRLAQTTQARARGAALAVLRAAGGDRVAVYSIENHAGTPIYVHAKICVIDDIWAAVGSDNLNLRSWTHDSELSCAVMDESRPGLPQQLRLMLAREHLDRADGDDGDLRDPTAAFAAFADAADRMDTCYADGCVGPRPPGRLRRYRLPAESWWTRAAAVFYRPVFDPDGRPRPLRRQHAF